MADTVEISNLNKTWIFDIDGTLFKYDGYKTEGKDTILPGVREFMDKIPKEDAIIIISAREKQYEKFTKKSLKENKIRYDKLIIGVPVGERILVNDIKPRGLKCAIAVNTQRDVFMEENFVVNEEL